MDELWVQIGQALMWMVMGALLVWLERLRQWAMERYKDHKLSAIPSAVRRSRTIYEYLVSLRTILNADRAYAVMFHNGGHFACGEPIWRISRVVETAGNGISRLSESQQSIQVSCMWEVVEPLFDAAPKAGVLRLHCPDCPNCAAQGTGMREDALEGIPKLLWAVRSVLGDSQLYHLLAQQGVTAIAIAPLIRKKEVVGYIAVDFCDDSFATLHDRPQRLPEVCETARRVSFELEAIKE